MASDESISGHIDAQVSDLRKDLKGLDRKVDDLTAVMGEHSKASLASQAHILSEVNRLRADHTDKTIRHSAAITRIESERKTVDKSLIERLENYEKRESDVVKKIDQWILTFNKSMAVFQAQATRGEWAFKMITYTAAIFVAAIVIAFVVFLLSGRMRPSNPVQTEHAVTIHASK